MRVGSGLSPSSLLLATLSLGASLGACKAEPPPAKSEAAASTEPGASPRIEAELGAYAAPERREAMAALAELELLLAGAEPFATAPVLAAWSGPLSRWVNGSDRALGRGDATRLDESVVRLENPSDASARQDELLSLVTGLRTAAAFELRQLLAAASDIEPKQVSVRERVGLWDDAWCLWEGALRPLARRADRLPERGGEDWEASIVEAFSVGRAALLRGDPGRAGVSRQIIEKGGYAVAHRLIVAGAEQPPATEAAALLDMLEDRVADRNGPGLARTQAMLAGPAAALDPALIERELAVAFAKRARKYCDKAVVHAELGTAGALAEAWEGVVYTKIMLPSMREALSAEGFDADTYLADWSSYLEAVEDGSPDAAAIAERLVEWNCAYQDRLGIAACSSSSNELQ